MRMLVGQPRTEHAGQLDRPALGRGRRHRFLRHRGAGLLGDAIRRDDWYRVAGHFAVCLCVSSGRGRCGETQPRSLVLLRKPVRTAFTYTWQLESWTANFSPAERSNAGSCHRQTDTAVSISARRYVFCRCIYYRDTMVDSKLQLNRSVYAIRFRRNVWSGRGVVRRIAG